MNRTVAEKTEEAKELKGLIMSTTVSKVLGSQCLSM